MITTENLGKSYTIGHMRRTRTLNFREALVSSTRSLVQRLRHPLSSNSELFDIEEFWALRDISFSVERGEALSIMGPNGCGKSTLLQIVSGILQPTQGRVVTKGRIAALLELGAGFNPEFTGRDNVYLNAALLGLSQDQINERFDRIAAFADIGQFIDQPVKTYSSGMYVRLAFSVIAHVDADILVVDEALSVGDAVFNQKCMRFIRSFQERGTLLFVSHEMAAVQNLCKSAMWLGHGRVQKIGPSKEIAESYLHYTLQEVYGDKVKLETATSAVDQGANENDNDDVFLDYESKFYITDNIDAATGWKTGAAEILSLTKEDYMKRRLQSIVVKKGYAKTHKQARQLITHKHITINGNSIDSPSHITTLKEEADMGANLVLALKKELSKEEKQFLKQMNNKEKTEEKEE